LLAIFASEAAISVPSSSMQRSGCTSSIHLSIWTPAFWIAFSASLWTVWPSLSSPSRLFPWMSWTRQQVISQLKQFLDHVTLLLLYLRGARSSPAGRVLNTLPRTSLGSRRRQKSSSMAAPCYVFVSLLRNLAMALIYRILSR